MRSGYVPQSQVADRPCGSVGPVPSEVLDQLMREGPLTASDVEAESQRFKKALIERALGAELSHHLRRKRFKTPGTAGAANVRVFLTIEIRRPGVPAMMLTSSNRRAGGRSVRW